jgi:regulator of cell morphogenesis and NO signaling
MTNVIRSAPPAPYRIPMTTPNTVADLVIAVPKAIAVLERLGIDYCCHGAQSIQQACSGASITSEELLTMIAEAPAAAPERAFSDEPIPEIIDFILGTHHAYTRAALETLEPLAAKVAGVHGANHPELNELKELVNALCAELIPHMMKEEEILFPFMLGESEACFSRVAAPIRVMTLEHEAVGELLASIRRVTNDLALPPEACRSYAAYFDLLQELEQDLHRHIHVENNVLFPKALNEFAHV